MNKIGTIKLLKRVLLFFLTFSIVNIYNSAVPFTAYAADYRSLHAIQAICGTEEKNVRNVSDCHVQTIDSHNPYDLTYDYGEDYQTYVKLCDWSLVFDADYYIETFPMLALLYHYDKGLLLEHFQTIGVHEGRQGSKKFNVGAYKMNCNNNVVTAFGDNYEGYYFYYMLNYSTQKKVNSVSSDKGEPVYTQYCEYLTPLQLAELDRVNEYRKEKDVKSVVIDGEACALANYRAYINAHDGWEAHDWAIKNTDTLYGYCEKKGSSCFGENTVTTRSGITLGMVCASNYRYSKKHYACMINKNYGVMGVSNVYNGKGKSSQFDFYIDKWASSVNN